MSTIEVVENPRRKRRRRKLSRKQIAAGFGGKRRRTVRRRRRNPALASLGNPRRRTYRRRRPRYTVTGIARRRRRNPSFGPLGVDLTAAVYIGIGMFGSEMLPRFAKKAWAGLPTVGPMGYLVKAASAVAVGFGVGQLTNRRNGQLAAAGGLALIMVDLFRQYVAPRIGLGGLGNDLTPVSYADISDVAGYTGENMAGYVEADGGLRGYVESPVGVY